MLSSWTYFAAVVLVLSAAAISEVPEERAASDYLSEHEVSGLYVLEPLGKTLRVYEKQDSKPVELEAAWQSMADARRALEVALSIAPPEPYQLPWAIFTSQGQRIEDIDKLLKCQVAFLLLVGQWMWPAVRVGFEQVASGVLQGAPLTLRTLSLRPVVFEVEGFILPEEADAAISLGKSKQMENSLGSLTTADSKSKRAHNDFRTSTQTWLRRHESQVVADLDDRTANLTRIPIEHNEDVQLLRYAEGQFYYAHLDWADLAAYNGQRDMWLGKHYGWRQRMATLFWYLSTVTKGGETVFPKHGQPICPGIRADCEGTSSAPAESCDVGLKISPKRGNVILWYNLLADGRGDFNSLHSGCPPAAGEEKWSGNKWIHTKSLQEPSAQWMPLHPALFRYVWEEDDPNACRLDIRSKHSQPAQLLWLHPDTGERKEIGSILPGKGSGQSSYKGHAFVLAVKGVESKPFECVGSASRYFFTEGLSVIPEEDREEL